MFSYFISTFSKVTVLLLCYFFTYACQKACIYHLVQACTSVGVANDSIGGDIFGVEAKKYSQFLSVLTDSPREDFLTICAHGSTCTQCNGHPSTSPCPQSSNWRTASQPRHLHSSKRRWYIAYDFASSDATRSSSTCSGAKPFCYPT